MRAWGLPHSRQLDSQLRDLAARMRPRCDHSSHPLQERACGTPDAQRIRSLVRKSEKHTSVVTTNTPKTSGVPHAMGYGLLRALPGDRSICFVTVVATEDVSLPGWAGLSGATFANVRASGPHDLGRPGNVVVSASSATHRPFHGNPPCCLIRAWRCRVHRIPPRVRDDREPPLLGRDMPNIREV
jgi:hypothetical protein